ncbi:hypothetical protein P353_16885 [Comamonas testosteroni]|uniref:DUF4760 domain-containing protein n=1 Tax=Comamonas testosteroni TaxID=285 RepID=A0A096HGC9_COMTE|nr:hypothetical protein P353_16885 [Comamonas testosteroni]
MNISPDWVSAAASTVAAVGVVFAFGQLRVSKDIAQLQFEDGLAKEYRELASRIPTRALLGQPLPEDQYQRSFDEFYRYVDLSNEQVSLRQRGRIGEVVWRYWCSGIQANLALPSFKRAWLEIQSQSNSFQELRRLESEAFKVDPKTWQKASTLCISGDTQGLSASASPHVKC